MQVNTQVAGLKIDLTTIHSPLEVTEVAEWLRRWNANPMCSARVGSNPLLVGEWHMLSCQCN